MLEPLALKMSLRLGDLAPDFEANCFFSSSQSDRIKFSEFAAGKWVILFSHPADFTPVCTTELARVASLKPEWEALGCLVVGLSTDTVPSHRAWVADICDYMAEKYEISQSGSEFPFPIIADYDLAVSLKYGMLDQECHDPSNFDPKTSAPLPIRTVFILDPRRRVRLMLTYPAAVGRNFDEILRCLDALQKSDKYKIATPADWKQGERVIVRFDVSDEEAKKIFPEHEAFKPYLRFTPFNEEN